MTSTVEGEEDEKENEFEGEQEKDNKREEEKAVEVLILREVKMESGTRTDNPDKRYRAATQLMLLPLTPQPSNPPRLVTAVAVGYIGLQLRHQRVSLSRRHTAGPVAIRTVHFNVTVIRTSSHVTVLSTVR